MGHVSSAWLSLDLGIVAKLVSLNTFEEKVGTNKNKSSKGK